MFAGIDGARAGHVRVYARRQRRRDARAYDPAFPDDAADAASSGTLDDAVDAVRGGARATRPACACCAPTCRSAATCRAASTARSSPRSACAPRARSSRRSRCASRTPSTTRPTFQRRWPSTSAASTTRCVVVARRHRARLPRRHPHTERPILRTAPAPLFLLSQLVRDAGIKVVLTGEGADEMFAGYDLFREAKVRRFWARAAGSRRWRPRLLERLYPVPGAVAGGAAGDGAAVLRPAASTRWREPGLRPRAALARRPRALKRLFSPDAARSASAARDARGELLGDAAGGVRALDAAGAGPVPRGAHAAVRLPAVVAGRPDADGALGRGPLPVPRPQRGRARRVAAAGLQAARARREARAQARGRATSCRRRSCARKKQPYRAPDALSFAGAEAPEWIDEVAGAAALAEAGVLRAGGGARS